MRSPRVAGGVLGRGRSGPGVAVRARGRGVLGAQGSPEVGGLGLAGLGFVGKAGQRPRGERVGCPPRERG